MLSWLTRENGPAASPAATVATFDAFRRDLQKETEIPILTGAPWTVPEGSDADPLTQPGDILQEHPRDNVQSSPQKAHAPSLGSMSISATNIETGSPSINSESTHPQVCRSVVHFTGMHVHYAARRAQYHVVYLTLLLVPNYCNTVE